MNKRTPLVGEQYMVPFILIISLFFLWGFAHAILDVLNKHFQELLHINKTVSAFIQAMMYMGYFVMAIPAGLFISRFGYRRGVVFGLYLDWYFMELVRYFLFPVSNGCLIRCFCLPCLLSGAD